MKKPRAFFPRVRSIAFEGPKSTNALAFRHYDPDEVFDGRTLSAHLRFSIAYWHSFRGIGSDPFGPAGTIQRPWEKHGDAMTVALTRMDAAFEFFQKIRAPFWCFHDRDIAPEGRTLAESNRLLDQVVAHAKDLQKATGIKLLWGTANLFSNPRYMCGAATNPDAHVFAYAAAQVKKALEVTKRARRRELRLLGRPRRLRDAAQHEPEAGAGPPRARSCTWRSTTRRRSASRASS